MHSYGSSYQASRYQESVIMAFLVVCGVFISVYGLGECHYTQD